MISLEGIQIRYPRGPVVLDVRDSLQFPPGQVISLVGPNGGGKTTLLRCAAGLLKPQRGTVTLNGTPLYGPDALSRVDRAQHIAVVLTELVAPAYLRVGELVALGRLPQHTTDDATAITAALHHTEAHHLYSRWVGSLSDGERQRVMIARALAQEPRILLLDEPTAHLDPPHQTALFQLLEKLVRTNVVECAVIATHQLHLAMHFSNFLVLVNREVHGGQPQVLAENGSLERIFSSDPSIALDTGRGWFVPNSPHRS